MNSVKNRKVYSKAISWLVIVSFCFTQTIIDPAMVIASEAADAEHAVKNVVKATQSHTLESEESPLPPGENQGEGYPHLKKGGRGDFSPSSDRVSSPLETLATVAQAYKGAGDREIIIIEDYHAHFNSQLNTARILQVLCHPERSEGSHPSSPYISPLKIRGAGGLTREAPIRLIGLEGGIGTLSMLLFQAIPDPQVRKEVSEIFMRAGYMSGPEYYSAVADENIILVGLEDAGLYQKNLAQFRKTWNLMQKGGEKELKSLRKRLNDAQEKIWPREIKTLARTVEGYHEGIVPHNKYLETLLSAADKHGVVIASEAKQSNESVSMPVTVNPAPMNVIPAKAGIHTLSELQKAKRIYSLSKLIQKERLKVELKSLSIELNNKLNTAEQKQLSILTLQYRVKQTKPADYFQWIAEKAESAGLNMKERYPQFTLFLEKTLLTESVSKENLQEEAELLSAHLFEKLITEERGRAVLQLTRQLRLFSNLVHLKAKHEEFEEIKKNVTFEQVIVGLEGIKSPQPPLPFNVIPAEAGIHTFSPLRPKRAGGVTTLIRAERTARTFYRDAARRDAVLLSKMLKWMEHYGEKKAVIFCGGYHSEGISRSLRENNMDHAVLVPKIEGDRTNEAYLRTLVKSEGVDWGLFMSAMQGIIAYLRSLSTHLDHLSATDQNVKTTLEQVAITLALVVHLKHELEKPGTMPEADEVRRLLSLKLRELRSRIEAWQSNDQQRKNDLIAQIEVSLRQIKLNVEGEGTITLATELGAVAPAKSTLPPGEGEGDGSVMPAKAGLQTLFQSPHLRTAALIAAIILAASLLAMVLYIVLTAAGAYTLASPYTLAVLPTLLGLAATSGHESPLGNRGAGEIYTRIKHVVTNLYWKLAGDRRREIDQLSKTIRDAERELQSKRDEVTRLQAEVNSLTSRKRDSPTTVFEGDHVQVVAGASRIVPIPDIHGDLGALITFFKGNSLLSDDDSKHFSERLFEVPDRIRDIKVFARDLAEKINLQPGTVIAFLGDYVDRGSQNAHVIEFVMALRERAAKQKDVEIVTVMGNHDFVFAELFRRIQASRVLRRLPKMLQKKRCMEMIRSIAKELGFNLGYGKQSDCEETLEQLFEVYGSYRKMRQKGIVDFFQGLKQLAIANNALFVHGSMPEVLKDIDLSRIAQLGMNDIFEKMKVLDKDFASRIHDRKTRRIRELWGYVHTDYEYYIYEYKPALDKLKTYAKTLDEGDTLSDEDKASLLKILGDENRKDKFINDVAYRRRITADRFINLQIARKKLYALSSRLTGSPLDAFLSYCGHDVYANQLYGLYLSNEYKTLIDNKDSPFADIRPLDYGMTEKYRIRGVTGPAAIVITPEGAEATFPFQKEIPKLSRDKDALHPAEVPEEVIDIKNRQLDERKTELSGLVKAKKKLDDRLVELSGKQVACTIDELVDAEAQQKAILNITRTSLHMARSSIPQDAVIKFEYLDAGGQSAVYRIVYEYAGEIKPTGLLLKIGWTLDKDKYDAQIAFREDASNSAHTPTLYGHSFDNDRSPHAIIVEKQIEGRPLSHTSKDLDKMVAYLTDLWKRTGITITDPKPDNFMIDRRGQIILIDSGSLRKTQDAHYLAHALNVYAGRIHATNRRYFPNLLEAIWKNEEARASLISYAADGSDVYEENYENPIRTAGVLKVKRVTRGLERQIQLRKEYSSELANISEAINELREVERFDRERLMNAYLDFLSVRPGFKSRKKKTLAKLLAKYNQSVESFSASARPKLSESVVDIPMAPDAVRNTQAELERDASNALDCAEQRLHQPSMESLEALEKELAALEKECKSAQIGVSQSLSAAKALISFVKQMQEHISGKTILDGNSIEKAQGQASGGMEGLADERKKAINESINTLAQKAKAKRLRQSATIGGTAERKEIFTPLVGDFWIKMGSFSYKLTQAPDGRLQLQRHEEQSDGELKAAGKSHSIREEEMYSIESLTKRVKWRYGYAVKDRHIGPMSLSISLHMLNGRPWLWLHASAKATVRWIDSEEERGKVADVDVAAAQAALAAHRLMVIHPETEKSILDPALKKVEEAISHATPSSGAESPDVTLAEDLCKLARFASDSKTASLDNISAFVAEIRRRYCAARSDDLLDFSRTPRDRALAEDIDNFIQHFVPVPESEEIEQEKLRKKWGEILKNTQLDPAQRNIMLFSNLYLTLGSFKDTADQVNGILGSLEAGEINKEQQLAGYVTALLAMEDADLDAQAKSSVPQPLLDSLKEESLFSKRLAVLKGSEGRYVGTLSRVCFAQGSDIDASKVLNLVESQTPLRIIARTLRDLKLPGLADRSRVHKSRYELYLNDACRLSPGLQEALDIEALKTAAFPERFSEDVTRQIESWRIALVHLGGGNLTSVFSIRLVALDQSGHPVEIQGAKVHKTHRVLRLSFEAANVNADVKALFQEELDFYPKGQAPSEVYPQRYGHNMDSFVPASGVTGHPGVFVTVYEEVEGQTPSQLLSEESDTFAQAAIFEGALEAIFTGWNSGKLIEDLHFGNLMGEFDRTGKRYSSGPMIFDPGVPLRKPSPATVFLALMFYTSYTWRDGLPVSLSENEAKQILMHMKTMLDRTRSPGAFESYLSGVLAELQSLSQDHDDYEFHSDIIYKSLWKHVISPLRSKDANSTVMKVLNTVIGSRALGNIQTDAERRTRYEVKLTAFADKIKIPGLDRVRLETAKSAYAAFLEAPQSVSAMESLSDALKALGVTEPVLFLPELAALEFREGAILRHGRSGRLFIIQSANENEVSLVEVRSVPGEYQDYFVKIVAKIPRDLKLMHGLEAAESPSEEELRLISDLNDLLSREEALYMAPRDRHKIARRLSALQAEVREAERKQQEVRETLVPTTELRAILSREPGGPVKVALEIHALTESLFANVAKIVGKSRDDIKGEIQEIVRSRDTLNFVQEARQTEAFLQVLFARARDPLVVFEIIKAYSKHLGIRFTLSNVSRAYLAANAGENFFETFPPKIVDQCLKLVQEPDIETRQNIFNRLSELDRNRATTLEQTQTFRNHFSELIIALTRDSDLKTLFGLTAELPEKVRDTDSLFLELHGTSYFGIYLKNVASSLKENTPNLPVLVRSLSEHLENLFKRQDAPLSEYVASRMIHEICPLLLQRTDDGARQEPGSAQFDLALESIAAFDRILELIYASESDRAKQLFLEEVLPGWSDLPDPRELRGMMYLKIMKLRRELEIADYAEIVQRWDAKYGNYLLEHMSAIGTFMVTERTAGLIEEFSDGKGELIRATIKDAPAVLDVPALAEVKGGIDSLAFSFAGSGQDRLAMLAEIFSSLSRNDAAEAQRLAETFAGEKDSELLYRVLSMYAAILMQSSGDDVFADLSRSLEFWWNLLRNDPGLLVEFRTLLNSKRDIVLEAERQNIDWLLDNAPQVGSSAETTPVISASGQVMGELTPEQLLQLIQSPNALKRGGTPLTFSDGSTFSLERIEHDGAQTQIYLLKHEPEGQQAQVLGVVRVAYDSSELARQIFDLQTAFYDEYEKARDSKAPFVLGQALFNPEDLDRIVGAAPRGHPEVPSGRPNVSIRIVKHVKGATFQEMEGDTPVENILEALFVSLLHPLKRGIGIADPNKGVALFRGDNANIQAVLVEMDGPFVQFEQGQIHLRRYPEPALILMSFLRYLCSQEIDGAVDQGLVRLQPDTAQTALKALSAAVMKLDPVNGKRIFHALLGGALFHIKKMKERYDVAGGESRFDPRRVAFASVDDLVPVLAGDLQMWLPVSFGIIRGEEIRNIVESDTALETAVGNYESVLSTISSHLSEQNLGEETQVAVMRQVEKLVFYLPFAADKLAFYENFHTEISGALLGNLARLPDILNLTAASFQTAGLENEAGLLRVFTGMQDNEKITSAESLKPILDDFRTYALNVYLERQTFVSFVARLQQDGAPATELFDWAYEVAEQRPPLIRALTDAFVSPNSDNVWLAYLVQRYSMAANEGEKDAILKVEQASRGFLIERFPANANDLPSAWAANHFAPALGKLERDIVRLTRDYMSNELGGRVLRFLTKGGQTLIFEVAAADGTVEDLMKVGCDYGHPDRFTEELRAMQPTWAAKISHLDTTTQGNHLTFALVKRHSGETLNEYWQQDGLPQGFKDRWHALLVQRLAESHMRIERYPPTDPFPSNFMIEYYDDSVYERAFKDGVIHEGLAVNDEEAETLWKLHRSKDIKVPSLVDKRPQCIDFGALYRLPDPSGERRFPAVAYPSLLVRLLGQLQHVGIMSDARAGIWRYQRELASGKTPSDTGVMYDSEMVSALLRGASDAFGDRATNAWASMIWDLDNGVDHALNPSAISVWLLHSEESKKQIIAALDQHLVAQESSLQILRQSERYRRLTLISNWMLKAFPTTDPNRLHMTDLKDRIADLHEKPETATGFLDFLLDPELTYLTSSMKLAILAAIQNAEFGDARIDILSRQNLSAWLSENTEGRCSRLFTLLREAATFLGRYGFGMDIAARGESLRDIQEFLHALTPVFGQVLKDQTDETTQSWKDVLQNVLTPVNDLQVSSLREAQQRSHLIKLAHYFWKDPYDEILSAHSAVISDLHKLQERMRLQPVIASAAPNIEGLTLNLDGVNVQDLPRNMKERMADSGVFEAQDQLALLKNGLVSALIENNDTEKPGRSIVKWLNDNGFAGDVRASVLSRSDARSQLILKLEGEKNGRNVAVVLRAGSIFRGAEGEREDAFRDEMEIMQALEHKLGPDGRPLAVRHYADNSEQVYSKGKQGFQMTLALVEHLDVRTAASFKQDIRARLAARKTKLLNDMFQRCFILKTFENRTVAESILTDSDKRAWTKVESGTDIELTAEDQYLLADLVSRLEAKAEKDRHWTKHADDFKSNLKALRHLARLERDWEAFVLDQTMGPYLELFEAGEMFSDIHEENAGFSVLEVPGTYQDRDAFISGVQDAARNARCTIPAAWLGRLWPIYRLSEGTFKIPVSARFFDFDSPFVAFEKEEEYDVEKRIRYPSPTLAFLAMVFYNARARSQPQMTEDIHSFWSRFKPRSGSQYQLSEERIHTLLQSIYNAYGVEKAEHFVASVLYDLERKVALPEQPYVDMAIAQGKHRRLIMKSIRSFRIPPFGERGDKGDFALQRFDAWTETLNRAQSLSGDFSGKLHLPAGFHHRLAELLDLTRIRQQSEVPVDLSEFAAGLERFFSYYADEVRGPLLERLRLLENVRKELPKTEFRTFFNHRLLEFFDSEEVQWNLEALSDPIRQTIDVEIYKIWKRESPTFTIVKKASIAQQDRRPAGARSARFAPRSREEAVSATSSAAEGQQPGESAQAENITLHFESDRTPSGLIMESLRQWLSTSPSASFTDVMNALAKHLNTLESPLWKVAASEGASAVTPRRLGLTLVDSGAFSLLFSVQDGQEFQDQLIRITIASEEEFKQEVATLRTRAQRQTRTVKVPAMYNDIFDPIKESDRGIGITRVQHVRSGITGSRILRRIVENILRNETDGQELLALADTFLEYGCTLDDLLSGAKSGRYGTALRELVGLKKIQLQQVATISTRLLPVLRAHSSEIRASLGLINMLISDSYISGQMDIYDPHMRNMLFDIMEAGKSRKVVDETISPWGLTHDEQDTLWTMYRQGHPVPSGVITYVDFGQSFDEEQVGEYTDALRAIVLLLYNAPNFSIEEVSPLLKGMLKGYAEDETVAAERLSSALFQLKYGIIPDLGQAQYVDAVERNREKAFDAILAALRNLPGRENLYRLVSWKIMEKMSGLDDKRQFAAFSDIASIRTFLASDFFREAMMAGAQHGAHKATARKWAIYFQKRLKEERKTRFRHHSPLLRELMAKFASQDPVDGEELGLILATAPSYVLQSIDGGMELDFVAGADGRQTAMLYRREKDNVALLDEIAGNEIKIAEQIVASGGFMLGENSIGSMVVKTYKAGDIKDIRKGTLKPLDIASSRAEDLGRTLQFCLNDQTIGPEDVLRLSLLFRSEENQRSLLEILSPEQTIVVLTKLGAYFDGTNVDPAKLAQNLAEHYFNRLEAEGKSPDAPAFESLWPFIKRYRPHDPTAEDPISNAAMKYLLASAKKIPGVKNIGEGTDLTRNLLAAAMSLNELFDTEYQTKKDVERDLRALNLLTCIAGVTQDGTIASALDKLLDEAATTYGEHHSSLQLVINARNALIPPEIIETPESTSEDTVSFLTRDTSERDEEAEDDKTVESGRIEIMDEEVETQSSTPEQRALDIKDQLAKMEKRLADARTSLDVNQIATESDLFDSLIPDPKTLVELAGPSDQDLEPLVARVQDHIAYWFSSLSPEKQVRLAQKQERKWFPQDGVKSKAWNDDDETLLFYHKLYQELGQHYDGETKFFVGGSDVVRLMQGRARELPAGSDATLEVNILGSYANKDDHMDAWKNLEVEVSGRTVKVDVNVESTGSLEYQLREGRVQDNIMLKWSLVALTKEGIEIYPLDHETAQDYEKKRLRLPMDLKLSDGEAIYNLIVAYNGHQMGWTFEDKTKNVIEKYLLADASDLSQLIQNIAGNVEISERRGTALGLVNFLDFVRSYISEQSAEKLLQTVIEKDLLNAKSTLYEELTSFRDDPSKHAGVKDRERKLEITRRIVEKIVRPPVTPSKAVLSPAYWLASALVAPVDWVLVRLGRERIGRSFKEDFIVPLIEDGVLVIAAMCFRDPVSAYVIIRGIFVALHWLIPLVEQWFHPDRAPPIGRERTWLEKILIPFIASAVSVAALFLALLWMPAAAPVTAAFAAGLAAHVALNRAVTMTGVRWDKAMLDEVSYYLPGEREIAAAKSALSKVLGAESVAAVSRDKPSRCEQALGVLAIQRGWEAAIEKYSQANSLGMDAMRKGFAADPVSFAYWITGVARDTNVSALFDQLSGHDSLGVATMRSVFEISPYWLGFALTSVHLHRSAFDDLVQAAGWDTIRRDFERDAWEFGETLVWVSQDFRSKTFLEAWKALEGTLLKEGLRQALIQDFANTVYIMVSVAPYVEALASRISESGLDLKTIIQESSLTPSFTASEFAAVNAIYGLVKMLSLLREDYEIVWRKIGPVGVDPTNIETRFRGIAFRARSWGSQPSDERTRVGFDFQDGHSFEASHPRNYGHATLPYSPYKFDFTRMNAERRVAKAKLGIPPERKVIVLSSPSGNKGELDAILEAYEKIPESGRPLLVLAPRDPIPGLEQKASRLGTVYVRHRNATKSSLKEIGQKEDGTPNDIVIVNTQGELADTFLPAGDGAIVGEDRNIIEAVRLRDLPVLYFDGAWKNNKLARDLLAKHKAVVPVRKQQLADQISKMLSGPQAWEELGFDPTGFDMAAAEFDQEITPVSRLLASLFTAGEILKKKGEIKENSRGYEGLPNDTYTPRIKEALEKKSFSTVTWTETAVAPVAFTFESSPEDRQTIEVTEQMTLDEEALKEFHETAGELARTDSEFSEAIKDLTILFIAGQQAHYSVGRKQIYLARALLRDPPQLKRELYHEVIERHRVIQALSEDQKSELLETAANPEKRRPELQYAIGELGKKIHAQLVMRELGRTVGSAAVDFANVLDVKGVPIISWDLFEKMPGKGKVEFIAQLRTWAHNNPGKGVVWYSVKDESVANVDWTTVNEKDKDFLETLHKNGARTLSENPGIATVIFGPDGYRDRIQSHFSLKPAKAFVAIPVSENENTINRFVAFRYLFFKAIANMGEENLQAFLDRELDKIMDVSRWYLTAAQTKDIEQYRKTAEWDIVISEEAVAIILESERQFTREAA